MLDSLVHHYALAEIIDRGNAPDDERLASLTGATLADVHAALRTLEESHGLLLHPNSHRIWVIHPFATAPTLFLVRRGDRSWWAPCAWCAFGAASLVGGDVVIQSILGGETEPVSLRIVDGNLLDSGFVVHFSVPVARAWDNAHYFCSTVLVFRDADEAGRWSVGHGIAFGAVVPIERVWALARQWYGGHLSASWKKWTPKQAQELLTGLGFTGSFWEVPQSRKTF